MIAMKLKKTVAPLLCLKREVAIQEIGRNQSLVRDEASCCSFLSCVPELVFGLQEAGCYLLSVSSS